MSCKMINAIPSELCVNVNIAQITQWTPNVVNDRVDHKKVFIFS
jgi:hypothetical protein